MSFKILFLFFITLAISIAPCLSQNVSPSNVKVEELSEKQILQIVEEMEKRGLSENEAIGLARAKGMSNNQISILQKRLAEVKSGTGSSKGGKKSTVSTEEFSAASFLTPKAELDSTTIDTKIFGFSFFNNSNLTFEPSMNTPVSDSYILGAGDEIIIDIWGASQQTYQLMVNSNGEISIPLVGPLHVAGQTYKRANERIKNMLSTIYSDLRSANPRTFASIRMGQIKAIKVNVLGEVFAPGTYTISGTATLFNVLYLSGGPNKQGSFRDIQLIRNNEVIAHLDVYDYLINGKTQVNVSLMDNDIVMIPPYINRVKVEGEFKRTGIFEAKNEESVANMVNYAGGYNENAYMKHLKLYRNNGQERTFKEINKDNIGMVNLSNGDSLYVGKILNRYNNIVTISGAVFSPGNFEYADGLTLKQLIDKADGLIENAYLNRGVITRLKDDYTPENISFSVQDVIDGSAVVQLKKNDEILISSIDDMREEQIVSIWGEVQHMGVYPFAENITLADLIYVAGGLKESASQSTIEVMRRLSYDKADKSADVSSELFYFNVSRDLKLDDEGGAFVMQPYDEVFIRFMPGFEKSGVVTIAGQVMYSGNYGLSSRTERISDLIARAGGLSKNAYPDGAHIIRPLRISDEERAKREELMRQDSTVYFSDLEFDNISLDLKGILNNPGCTEDIFMRHGDVIRIPSTLQTVKISGEALNPSSTVFIKGYNVKRYINSSGGFSLNAKKSKTYVMYPNGASYASKGFLFFRKYPRVTPGSEIVIPKKPERAGMTTQAWVAMASAVASIGLTVSTIVNLNK